MEFFEHFAVRARIRVEGDRTGGWWMNHSEALLRNTLTQVSICEKDHARKTNHDEIDELARLAGHALLTHHAGTAADYEPLSYGLLPDRHQPANRAFVGGPRLLVVDQANNQSFYNFGGESRVRHGVVSEKVGQDLRGRCAEVCCI